MLLYTETIRNALIDWNVVSLVRRVAGPELPCACPRLLRAKSPWRASYTLLGASINVETRATIKSRIWPQRHGSLSGADFEARLAFVMLARARDEQHCRRQPSAQFVK